MKFLIFMKQYMVTQPQYVIKDYTFVPADHTFRKLGWQADWPCAIYFLLGRNPSTPASSLPADLISKSKCIFFC